MWRRHDILHPGRILGKGLADPYCHSNDLGLSAECSRTFMML